MADCLPWILSIGVVSAIVLYFAAVLRDEDDLKPPAPGLGEEVDKAKERARARASRRVTTARAPKAPPKFRPPAGAVGSPDRPGAGDDDAGLLRVLEDGPAFQRQAAAKALSVRHAGSRKPSIARALSEIVRRADVGDAARAEAYIALRVVWGVDLEWADEVAVRKDLGEADLDWLEKVEAGL